MNVMQQQSLLMSAILLSCFLSAMEQEVPHISTTGAVAQENVPPNQVLKEFFVKGAWQAGFDQAQFYKSHPDMFGVPSPIVQSLPTLIPDVCKNVLSYDYTYTKTALGFVGLSNADKYSTESLFDRVLFCQNLNNLSVIKVDTKKKDSKFTWVNDGIDFQFNVHICRTSKNQVYRVYDYYSRKNNSYPFKSVSIDDFGANPGVSVDGLNRYGNFVFLQYVFAHSSDYYRFAIFNIDPWDKVLPEYKSYCYAGRVTSFGLHYASNRVSICSFDNNKNVAKICVYDFNVALSSKDKNSLITWQGKLPAKFKKCIFVTTSTLLGITEDGKLYSMALKDDRSISVHRQVLKDLDKKDLFLKDMAVDFMDPRRVVFIDRKKEDLYFMDLKSEKKSFVKIQDKLFEDPVDGLYCGDGKIGIKVEQKYFAMHEIYVQNFDYIPF